MTAPERILVALDGQPAGQRALEYALNLADALNARVEAVVVEGKLPRYAASVREVDDAKREKDKFFDTVARLARDQAAEHGLDLEPELAAGSTATAIVREAEYHGSDLIVMGYRGHFGLAASRVCRRAPCPVLIVRGTD